MNHGRVAGLDQLFQLAPSLLSLSVWLWCNISHLQQLFSFFLNSKHFLFFPFCCVNQIVLEMDALVCVCVWNCPESRFLGVFEEEQSNTMVLLLILPFSFRKTKTKSGSKSDLDLHRFTAGLLLLTVLLALPPGPENSQWELHYSCKSHFNKHTHTQDHKRNISFVLPSILFLIFT